MQRMTVNYISKICIHESFITMSIYENILDWEFSGLFEARLGKQRKYMEIHVFCVYSVQLPKIYEIKINHVNNHDTWNPFLCSQSAKLKKIAIDIITLIQSDTKRLLIRFLLISFNNTTWQYLFKSLQSYFYKHEKYGTIIDRCNHQ